MVCGVISLTLQTEIAKSTKNITTRASKIDTQRGFGLMAFNQPRCVLLCSYRGNAFIAAQ
tara:strand:+ start:1529 stop:1708 length:180 start_codon:yes stop_codon:yes gene_type:complete